MSSLHRKIRIMQGALELSEGTLLSIAREIAGTARLRSIEELAAPQMAMLVCWLEQAQSTTLAMERLESQMMTMVA